MGFIIGLAPVLMFWFVPLYTEPAYGLWTALGLSVFICLCNATARRFRAFDIVMLCLFAVLAVWTVRTGSVLPRMAGAAVSTTVLLAILGSVATSEPFTKANVRARPNAQPHDSDLVQTVHRRISLAWATVFAALTPVQFLVASGALGPFVFGKLLPVFLIGTGLVLSDWYFDSAVRRNAP